MHTGTSPSRIEPVLDIVLRELHRPKTEPVSPGDLRRVKEQLIISQVIGMETSASRASHWAASFWPLVIRSAWKNVRRASQASPKTR